MKQLPFSSLWVSLLTLAACNAACSTAARSVPEGPTGNPTEAEPETPEVPEGTEPEEPTEPGVALPVAVQFEDPALETCVRQGLAQPSGAVMSDQVATLGSLSCPDSRIRSLRGLEYATSATELSFWENEITDLSPLAGLHQLTSLVLGKNTIVDISPLASLTKLTRLDLAQNRITSVSALSKMSDLAWLNLDHNGLDDGALATLGGLSKLTWVTAEYNKFSSTKALRGALATGDVYGASAAPSGVTPGTSRPLWAPPETRGPAFLYAPKQAQRQTSVPSLRRVSDGPVSKVLALDKLALASPNQLDAGSCLYMSNTGAMEILVNQRTTEKLAPNGLTDFSERYLMNASGRVPRGTIPYAITDTVYTYNAFGGALLNRDYPFTMGYMTTDADGNRSPANPENPDAELSCAYNWEDDLPADWKSKLVPTPQAERTILFVDPAKSKNSVWNVGLVGDDVIERIKYELRTRNTPVIVVYNHFLYWHAVVVVGYDDEATVGECPMVKQSIQYFKQNKAASYATKIESWMASQGGCKSKGIFYVRDSIYAGGKEEAYYTYTDGQEDKYSKRIVTHEQDWVKYLGNHAYAIHRK